MTLGIQERPCGTESLVAPSSGLNRLLDDFESLLLLIPSAAYETIPKGGGVAIARHAPGAHVLVEVNLALEPQKGGCAPTDVPDLADALSGRHDERALTKRGDHGGNEFADVPPDVEDISDCCGDQNRPSAGEKASLRKYHLVVHWTSGVLPNESRLSCGAELEGSRTEFYTTETGTLTAAW